MHALSPRQGEQSEPALTAPSGPAETLRELRRAHADLLAEIDGLAALTRAPEPDVDALTSSRWRLSRASRRRRALVGSLYGRLSPSATPAEAGQIRFLQTADQASVEASHSHVARWTVQTIRANWAAYCKASETMRASMKERVSKEQAVFYPLLERLARG